MDSQRFSKFCQLELARTERQQFTGRLDFRFFFRNGKMRRGEVVRKDCRVLKRDPVDHVIEPPAKDLDRLMSEIITEGPRADSEICLSYSFFSGVVVDRTEEVVNIMC